MPQPRLTDRRVILQAWSPAVFRCSDCGRTFHPMIYTQSGWIRLGAVTAGVGIYLAIAIPGPIGWAAAALALGLVVNALLTYRKERPLAGQRPRYGAIIAECIHCKSQQVAADPAFEQPTGRAFTLKDPNR